MKTYLVQGLLGVLCGVAAMTGGGEARAESPVPASYLDTVLGAFSDSARAGAESNYRGFEQGPFSASIHGIFHEIRKYRSIAEDYEEVSVRTRSLRGGDLSVQLHIAREGGRVRRAPLAIVLNPLFGEASFHQMTRFIEFFGERGFHVVVFSSTFADPVTRQAPAFYPGDLRAESAMHLEAIEGVIGRIGESNVSGATLVGLSYGAFLGAVVKADDSANPHPRINGPALLVDPPYDIQAAMQNLDRFVRESSNRERGCYFSFDIPRLLLNGLLEDDNQRIYMNEACAKAFLSSSGFHGRLAHSVEMLDDSLKLGLDSADVRDVTFAKYIDAIAHIRIEPAEMTELGYWISRAHERGYDSFLVVGAKDDPINERFDFAKSHFGPLSARHFLEVPTGGHTGLRSARSQDPACGSGSWFECLLEKVYPAPVRIAGVGACTNSQDAAIAKPAMEQKEMSCAKGCWGGKDCTAKCLVDAGLTAGCADCWGEVAACGKKHCALQCGISPGGSSCRACTAKHGCDAAFSACSGI